MSEEIADEFIKFFNKGSTLDLTSFREEDEVVKRFVAAAKKNNESLKIDAKIEVDGPGIRRKAVVPI